MDRRRWMFITLFAAMAAFAAPRPASAIQCYRCESRIWWCGYVTMNEEEFTDEAVESCNGQEWWEEDSFHRFWGPACTPEDGSSCRACGDESNCHFVWDNGGCHAPCTANFAALLERVNSAIIAKNVDQLGSILTSESGVSLDVQTATIGITSSCGGEGSSTKLSLERSLAIALKDQLTRPIQ